MPIELKPVCERQLIEKGRIKMRLCTDIRNAFLVSTLIWVSGALGSDTVCLRTIEPRLCKSLQTKEDTDWVSFAIYLYTPVDSIQSSDCDPKKDSCIIDTTSWVPDSITANLLEATRALFETYDLRWPDDLQTRAGVPTANGRRDTITRQYHRPNYHYKVYATKHSIFAISAEPYIGTLYFYEISDGRVSLYRPEIRGVTKRAGSSFNIKGQQTFELNAPIFSVPAPR